MTPILLTDQTVTAAPPFTRARRSAPIDARWLWSIRRRHQANRASIGACLFACFCLFMGVSRAAVIQTINPEGNPGDPQPFNTTYWGPTEVGWLYMPTFSYMLTGIETAFPGLGEQIGIELYDGNPVNGAQLLRSGLYTPPPILNSYDYPVFAGITFQPLIVVSGRSYFVGFTGVHNVPVNVLTAGRELPLIYNYLHTASPIIDSCATPCFGGDTNAPILRFDGSLSVPEADDLLTITTGLGLLLSRRRVWCR